MAASRSGSRKKGTRKKTSGARGRRSGSARKRLTPAREARGLAGAEVRLDPADPAIGPLVRAVEGAGGTPLGAYREPLAGRPLLLAVLPRGAVEPTPFQRDLSPTHTKRLAAKIEETGSFLDPILVVRGAEGGFWTPNGRHRLAAAKLLGLRQITALVSPEEGLAFRILALNTEKAHNLKDRSLEAIRMAGALAQRHPRKPESAFAELLEGPELLTLGLVYEQQGRFAGGAYAPFLKKVDRFSLRGIAASLREREAWAARLRDIDTRVVERVEALRRRGFRSPYLRNVVVARINPVRFHRPKKGDPEPPMTLAAALTRMAAKVRQFDPSSVQERDLALVAAASSE